MVNPIVEAEHLAMAERHVSEAKKLIADQESRVARLEADGVEKGGTAWELLQTMRAVLTNAEAHRDLIRQTLEQSKRGDF